jgi:hypothetical protein
MKRHSLFWLVAAIAFWSGAFAYDVQQATAWFVFSSIVGFVSSAALLIFHIVRARLGH